MPMVYNSVTNLFEGLLTHPQLIAFSLQNLCRHPEYLELLCEEVLQSGGVQFNHQNNELPLLDSFLKEAARMNPVTICM
jgi:cytochrome P450